VRSATKFFVISQYVTVPNLAALAKRLEHTDYGYEKFYSFLEGSSGFDPLHVFPVPTCYHEKFGSLAATSPQIELSTKNFTPLRESLPGGVGPKFNQIISPQSVHNFLNYPANKQMDKLEVLQQTT